MAISFVWRFEKQKQRTNTPLKVAITSGAINPSNCRFRTLKAGLASATFVALNPLQMAQLFTYLTFNGNCGQAMAFYQECLGGELHLQTVGESPMAEQLPQAMRDCILHATLKSNDLVLMGTDMAGDEGLTKGNAVSLMMQCGSLPELQSFYKKLANGGRETHPIERTARGAWLGGLTDKYGHSWLLTSSLS